ncbi:RNase H domain-containing protein [Trichonephila clavipes]|nr:RNase H domain-containing protein [Trichonephila clavipes]
MLIRHFTGRTHLRGFTQWRGAPKWRDWLRQNWLLGWRRRVEGYHQNSYGSRGEKGISGSGVYIPIPSGALEFKIKNPNYCSDFRSELIAIRRGLQCAAQLEDRFQEIWILTDIRASIQHLANWGDFGDQTSLDILSLLHDLSSGHSIHFQWIPSHVGIEGNERADFLARTAAVEDVSTRGNLTFSEISKISKWSSTDKLKLHPVMHGTLLNVRASPLDLSYLLILDF